MAGKQAYKMQNEAFMKAIAQKQGIKVLAKGVLCEVLKDGEGEVTPKMHNIVCVYYKGQLINGKTFDDNTGQGYPDALRLSELITGWQIALMQMRVGDKWRIYIPSDLGYGSRGTDGIPKNSALIFEIELISIM